VHDAVDPVARKAEDGVDIHAISRSTSSSEAIFSGISDEAARRRSTPFRCDHANRASASNSLDKRGCAQVPATPNVPIEPLGGTH
jgi:hypothetical protein